MDLSHSQYTEYFTLSHFAFGNSYSNEQNKTFSLMQSCSILRGDKWEITKLCTMASDIAF